MAKDATHSCRGTGGSGGEEVNVTTSDTIGKAKLGRTDLVVSRLCFGTSALADSPESYGYEVDEEQALATFRAIFRGPVKFVDTARIYGRGRGEERIGAVLREIGGLPEGFVLATKLDRDFETGRFDASVARRSLEASLKALGLDRVHLLHLHDPEYVEPLSQVTGRGGAIDELFRMKEEGLADAVGLAAGKVSVMMPMLRNWDFDAVLTHNRFTLLNRNAEAMVDFAVSRGMAVLNAAPYGSGILAKAAGSGARFAYREAPDMVQAHAAALHETCARYGVPLGAAALQFSMRDPRITSTVVGVSRPARVEETIAWATWPIPDDLWEELAGHEYGLDDPQGFTD
jgi:D-threo-aldose 1-dehydrogenase